MLAEFGAEPGVAGERAGCAVDVKLGVAPCAAVVFLGDVQQFFTVFVKHVGHLFEQFAALNKG